MATQNINDFLGELHRLYNIGVKNQEVIQKAMFATDTHVSVDIVDLDGKPTTITVPSFTYITQQQNAIKQNIDSMTKLQDGQGYAVLVDEVNGKIRQLFELSHNKTPWISNKVPAPAYDDAFLDNRNNLLNKLYNPNISYAFDCTDVIRSYSRQVLVTKLNIGSYTEYGANQAQIQALTDYDSVISYLSSNNIKFDESETLEDVEYYQSRYFGDFSVLEALRQDNGTFKAKFDTINYNDRNSPVKMSKEITPGTKLAMLNQNTLFTVLSVNVSTNELVLQRIYGFDELLVGVSNLTYVDDNTKRIVNVPVRFNENVVFFLSATHLIHGTMSGKSKPVLYSSKDIFINVGGDRVTVNDYLKASNSTDVKTFLDSLISQSSIPLKYAVIPNKPVINTEMFKVVQINKHIVEGAEVEYIKKLYASQNKIGADMKVTANNIDQYRTALDQGNYKNESDRKQLEQQLKNEQQKYNQQQVEYSTTVNDLSNKDLGLYATTYAPKYRVRGFWPVQDDMTSEFTRNQVIIAYRVQYRYVSANNKIANSDNFGMKEFVDGEEVETTGSFSVWQEFITPLRKRIIQPDGTVNYIANVISDANQININQLDVAIQKGEQVDVRIQAISEVGYPNVSVQSEWSDPVRVNFPPEFTTDIDFAKLQNEVREEKQKIELQGLLVNEGLVKHVSDSISEQHTYFAHPASKIDSGFKTVELNRISLFDKLNEFQQQIIQLQNIVINNNNTLSITLVDGHGNEYAITNGATLNVFAGYYTDEATLEPKGDIVPFQMYIKLSNSATTKIYSLNPGDPNLVTDIEKYANAPLGYVTDGGDNGTLPYGVNQTRSQIAYLRNRNVFNNGELYTENPALTTPWSNTIPAGSINTGAQESEKNVLHIQSGNLQKVALNDSDNTKFIAMSTDYPGYSSTSANANIKTYLESMSKLLTLPADDKQLENEGIEKVKTMFDIEYDKYLVGDLTTGSFLTLNPLTQSHIKVPSNSVDSYKEVTPNSEIWIPVLFQYRMTDALGRIGGKPNVTNTDVEYKKRVGVDMLLNGQIVQFDIVVSAKYTPSALSTNNMPKVGVSRNNNNGSPMN